MKTFDEEAWNNRELTLTNSPWAAQALNHEASLKNTWYTLHPSPEQGVDNTRVFTREMSYDYGIMVHETWMLPEDEYTTAYTALMAAMRNAPENEKDCWTGPMTSPGHYSKHYSNELSFLVLSYVVPEVRSNEGVEPVFMSTELMREYFPFLGSS
jgi:hypothetical protein